MYALSIRYTAPKSKFDIKVKRPSMLKLKKNDKKKSRIKKRREIKLKNN